MLHIITSNHIPINNIKTYTNNFVLTHLYRRNIPIPTKIPRTKLSFNIFHQPEMELDQDSYRDTVDMEFHFNECPDLTSSFDQIGESICSQYEKCFVADTDDSPEEFQIILACDKTWNQQGVKYLNSFFKEKGLDISVMNLYTYYGIVNYDKLKTLIQSVLNSEFIYPDDPISFSYALYQFIENKR